MKIETLVRNLPVTLLSGDPSIDITDVVEDSRKVTPGCLFIARSGTQADGRDYIDVAIADGAAAVLTGGPIDPITPVAALVTDDVADTGAHLAERFHGDPSRGLTVIGITGTNGKTTIAHLVQHLLNESGSKCGLIGTVQIDDGDSVKPACLTTPPAVAISADLRSMVDHRCRAAVLEASSHALDQSRVAGVAFDGAVFTNLSGDHMDYHPTLDHYTRSKARLFEMIDAGGWAVINIDDPVGATMAAACRGRVVTTSLDDHHADGFANIAIQSISRTEIQLNGPWGQLDLTLPLVGRHNVINALQAAMVGFQCGLSPNQIASGLASAAAPPGRLESVSALDQEFTVLIDYAHTDDALDTVLRALRPVLPEGGRLIVLFGCGGDRDRSKRPRMARAACRWGDEIIITSDNPRTEDPDAIVTDVAAGVPASARSRVHCEVDRRCAIQLAIRRACPGDVVLIAGKGHEDYQIIGHERRHFDDREIAAEALAELHARTIDA